MTEIRLRIMLAALLSILTGCDSDDNERITSTNPENKITETTYDFTELDENIEFYIDTLDNMLGMSYVVVNSEGVIHKKAFGNHNEDTAVVIASTSKVPTVMTIMALAEDKEYNFSISQPVSNYLNIDNEYTSRTVEQMISNTSGIPGLYDYVDYIEAAFPNLDFKDKNILQIIEHIIEQIQKLNIPANIVDVLKKTHVCQFMSRPLFDHTINSPSPELNNVARLIFNNIGPLLIRYRPSYEFNSCAEQVLNEKAYDLTPAGKQFRYGGFQWQLAGYTATQVSGEAWNTLFHKYIAGPCDLKSTAYRNHWSHWLLNGVTFSIPDFDRSSPDSLPGYDNPHVEGGLITILDDYAKLLQIHLNGGYCGDTQILSSDTISSMQRDRGGVVQENETPYGLGWWLDKERPSLFYDPGAYGALAFIDTELGIGAYIAVDNYDSPSLAYQAPHNITNKIQEQIIDIVSNSQTNN